MAGQGQSRGAAVRAVECGGRGREGRSTALRWAHSLCVGSEGAEICKGLVTATGDGESFHHAHGPDPARRPARGGGGGGGDGAGRSGPTHMRSVGVVQRGRERHRDGEI